MEFTLFKIRQKVLFKHVVFFFLATLIGFSLWNVLGTNKKNGEEIELSSVVESQRHMQEAQIKAMQRLSAQLPQNQQQDVPKRFRSNPAFKLFSYIRNSTTKADMDLRVPASEK